MAKWELADYDRQSLIRYHSKILQHLIIIQAHGSLRGIPARVSFSVGDADHTLGFPKTPNLALSCLCAQPLK